MQVGKNRNRPKSKNNIVSAIMFETVQYIEVTSPDSSPILYREKSHARVIGGYVLGPGSDFPSSECVVLRFSGKG